MATATGFADFTNFTGARMRGSRRAAAPQGGGGRDVSFGLDSGSTSGEGVSGDQKGAGAMARAMGGAGSGESKLANMLGYGATAAVIGLGKKGWGLWKEGRADWKAARQAADLDPTGKTAGEYFREARGERVAVRAEAKAVELGERAGEKLASATGRSASIAREAGATAEGRTLLSKLLPENLRDRLAARQARQGVELGERIGEKAAQLEAKGMRQMQYAEDVRNVGRTRATIQRVSDFGSRTMERARALGDKMGLKFGREGAEVGAERAAERTVVQTAERTAEAAARGGAQAAESGAQGWFRGALSKAGTAIAEKGVMGSLGAVAKGIGHGLGIVAFYDAMKHSGQAAIYGAYGLEEERNLALKQAGVSTAAGAASVAATGGSAGVGIGVGVVASVGAGVVNDRMQNTLDLNQNAQMAEYQQRGRDQMAALQDRMHTQGLRGPAAPNGAANDPSVQLAGNQTPGGRMTPASNVLMGERGGQLAAMHGVANPAATPQNVANPQGPTRVGQVAHMGTVAGSDQSPMFDPAVQARRQHEEMVGARNNNKASGLAA